MSLWIGIIATCEIPVVGRNYCIFLSFLDVLPVKDANMLIRSKRNTASRCLTARIPQLGFGRYQYLRNMSWCLYMISTLKHRPKINECKLESNTDSCSSFHSPCCSLLNCLNNNQLMTLPLDIPWSAMIKQHKNVLPIPSIGNFSLCHSNDWSWTNSFFVFQNDHENFSPFSHRQRIFLPILCLLQKASTMCVHSAALFT